MGKKKTVLFLFFVFSPNLKADEKTCLYILRAASGHGLPRLVEHGPITLDKSHFHGDEARNKIVMEKLKSTYGKNLPGRRPNDSSVTMPDAEYNRRLEGFATESKDEQSVVMKTIPDSNGRKTTIRLHLETGELLILDDKGRVGIYTRLPVGERGSGKFKSTEDILHTLFIPSIGVMGRNQLIAPRLTAGETFNSSGFGHKGSARTHFLKHVLNVRPGEMIADVVQKRPNDPDSEFREMQASFVKEWNTTPVEGREALIQKYADRYEETALQFLRSDDPQNLTLRVQEHGKAPIRLVRFNPVTNDFLVFSQRPSGIELISYYRVMPDMRRSNSTLENKGLPRVKNPFEYFLSSIHWVEGSTQ